HLANGGFHSSTCCQGALQRRRAAFSAQNPSGAFTERLYIASYCARPEMPAARMNASGGGEGRASPKTHSVAGGDVCARLGRRGSDRSWVPPGQVGRRVVASPAGCKPNAGEGPPVLQAACKRFRLPRERGLSRE